MDICSSVVVVYVNIQLYGLIGIIRSSVICRIVVIFVVRRLITTGLVVFFVVVVVVVVVFVVAIDYVIKMSSCLLSC